MLDGVLKAGRILAAVSDFARRMARKRVRGVWIVLADIVGGLCAPSRAPPARPMGMTISGRAVSHGAADRGPRGAGHPAIMGGV